ncbi:MAG: apolipoprotein N-acyltransferase [Gammaproteobacteria bacterium]|nr:apolipoprotein N-acyltransferase [Gammaproteobacteria bacterium]MBU2223324.1 apolipoprotein N-acyltransferase [Gammaproteobacteria bacterium]MBU2425935.1 apolipoprotein N-acyltransferase [Gammaproteobacteria bacterium]
MKLSRPEVFLSLLLLVAGLANTLAFAPYQLTIIPLFSLLLLSLVLYQSQTAGKAAWFGFVYGVGWFGLGISWVHVSIATFGGMPLVASIGIMVVLVAYLSLFPALAAWLTCHRRFHVTPSSGQRKSDWWPLLFASCWVIAENLRSWLFTGFPWLSLGYSQTEGLLAPYAPLIGETGITFLLVFAAASLGLLVHKQWKLAVVATLLLLLSPQLTQFKGWHLVDEKVSVALVQGNIKQELRWDPEQELPTMKKYMQLTKPHLQQQIIVWPEAAIPQVEPLAQAYLYNLDMQAAENNSAVITGILDYKRNNDAYNGMIVLGRTGANVSKGDYIYESKNRYQKHHLLPIGEFVPFERLLRDIAPFFDLPNSSFARGDWRQPNLQANNYQLLAALCFEIAFPRQIQANFTDNTNFILTVSNDAWFGASIGPLQHMQIAQMRALEFGRPLLRATNNGVTGIIKPDGHIQAVLPQFEDGVLAADVQLATGRTLYSQTGDSPLLLLAIFMILGRGFYTWRRNRKV